MILAAGHVGGIHLGAPLTATGIPDESRRAIVVEVNGVNWTDAGAIKAGTLDIDDTQGEPATCAFTVLNATIAPAVDDVVRVLYFSEVLFAGTIRSVKRKSDHRQLHKTYECECADWSKILVRRKLTRNFIGMSIPAIVDSLLDNELAGEGLSMGTIDRSPTIPLVDGIDVSAFDLIKDAAGVTGQTFYVDWDKRFQFRSTSSPAAPLTLNETILEDADVTIDLETYRNVMTVTVKGTPASAATTDAKTVTITKINEDQITARQALGGSGRYEESESITHPTSNDPTQLALLATAYARTRLAVSGVPRQTLTGRVRGYGFRAGQSATVSLINHLGVSGTWLIQRVSIKDENGYNLLHRLELVTSSLQQRAYESWLSIVAKGKTTIQMPSSITSNVQIFDTPGTDTWTVPAGVTIAEFTCKGAGGGGSGWWYYGTFSYAQGGYGGAGGLAVTTQDCIEGQVFDLTIGTRGDAGTNGYPNGDPPTYPTSGTDATVTKVQLSTVLICQANGGYGGVSQYPYAGVDGAPGNGAGDGVTVGGGFAGGLNGLHGFYSGDEIRDPTEGTSDGRIEVRW